MRKLQRQELNGDIAHSPLKILIHGEQISRRTHYNKPRSKTETADKDSAIKRTLENFLAEKQIFVGSSPPKKRYSEESKGFNSHIEGIMKMRRMFNCKNRGRSNCETDRILQGGGLRPMFIQTEINAEEQ